MHTRSFVTLIVPLVLLCLSSAQAQDGQGTAEFVGPPALVAGDPATFSIHISPGDAGIAPGGGVSVGIHHAATWPDIQVSDPTSPGFVEAIYQGQRLPLAQHAWFNRGHFADPRDYLLGDRIFHHCLVASLPEGLPKGETVEYRFGPGAGITAPRCAIEQHEFRVMTDADGDHVFAGLSQSPSLSIVAGPPHHLAGVVPSNMIVGESAAIRVRVEDQFFNHCGSYSGQVSILNAAGRELAGPAEVRDGLAAAELVPKLAGPLRLRLDAGELAGRCNPAMVHRQPPERRLYWGDIHGHTAVSDGLARTTDEYFEFGRDVAFLDVCALTDHGHFAWEETIASVKRYHRPGRYVTMLAQEAGAGPDHYNLYFRHDDEDHIEGWPNTHEAFNATVLEQYNSAPEPRVLVGAHHYSYDRGDDRYPFGMLDPRIHRFVEVYSSHGASEFLGNPRALPGARDPQKFLRAGLDDGVRFGVIASSDNHDSHPGRTIWGRYPGGLVGFRVESLTREAIWQALWDGTVYGTGFDRIYLDFAIDGQGMGSELRADGWIEVQILVVTATDEAVVELIEDGRAVRSESTRTGSVEFAASLRPKPGEHDYYVRVVQDNGEQAWSSPIWVTVP